MAGRYLDVTFSGTSVRANAVLLHSASGVRRWQAQIAEAQNLLGGVSTGIGFIGSPGFVLAGAAAIGILEAAVNNANQKKGLKVLAEAVQFHERLLERGVWVPVQEINGIGRPHPGNWSAEAEVEGELDLTGKGMFEKARLMSEWSISKEEAAAGLVYRSKRQPVVFLQDEFVWLNGEGGPIGVRWSAVDSYQLSS